MRLDLIEVKPKNHKIKIVVIVIISILFIVFFSMLGMYFAKLYKVKLIAEKKAQAQQQADAYYNQIQAQKENTTVPNIEDREHVKKTLMPVYSENAKKEMKNN